MTSEQLEQETTETVNAIGLKCPMPVIKLQQAVRKNAENNVIAIDFDTEDAKKDIASWAKVNKHRIELTIDTEKGYRLFLRSYALKTP